MKSGLGVFLVKIHLINSFQKNQTLNFTPLFVNPTNITKAFMNELVKRMKKNEDLTDEVELFSNNVLSLMFRIY